MARLDAGTRQLERVGPVATTGGDVFNEVTVSYAPFATSKRYQKRRVVTAADGQLTIDPQSETDTRILGSLAAKWSQDLYGVRPLEIQSSAIWDDATASLIASDKVAQHAIPKRAINYQGGPELEGYNVGSIVLLNDPELYISDEPAIIADQVVGAGQSVDLSLILLDRAGN